MTKVIPIRNGRHGIPAGSNSDKPEASTGNSSHVIPLRAGYLPVESSAQTTDFYGIDAARIQVSVVVPTCGRTDLLNRCLDALTTQNFSPTKYEIIVVDDGPSLATQRVVAAWTTRMVESKLNIIYVPNNGTHGPAAARNRGWQFADAPIIAFTDDDTVPTPNWLKAGLAAFDDEVHAVCGSVKMPLPDIPTDYERDAHHLETAEFVTANCFCRKEVLEALNGFDERFRLAWREDSDLHFRLLDHNANIVHVPDAVVVHPVRPARWGVSISQQRKILFDALLYKKHPRMYRQRIRSAPRWDYYLTVMALLVTVIGISIGNPFATGMAGGAWLALTASLFLKRIRNTRKTLPHVLEMALTSALIPLLSVFWRMVGAYKFRVRFL